MTIEIAKDFFVEVSEETVEKDVNLKVYLYLTEVRKALEVMRTAEYDSEEYNEAYHVGDKFNNGWIGEGYGTGLLDYCAYDEEYKSLWKECYGLYCERNAIEQDKYNAKYIDEFMAFERENVDYANGLWIGSEEDYGTYSDWSKDMFGYRKRWRVASRLSEQDSVLKGCMATETPYFYGYKDNL